MRRKRKIDRFILPVLIPAVAALLLAGCRGFGIHTVEVAPYLTVVFDGKNGSGTATLQPDSPGLYAAVYEAMGLAATPESGTPDAETANRALSALTLWAEPAEGLSNGDSVTVQSTVDTDKLAGTGLLLQCPPFTVQVEGLADADVVDPFQNLQIGWEGCSPNITMTLTPQSTDGGWGWVSYTAPGNTGLSAGDTVTVTAQGDAATLQRLGLILSRTTETYTVPDYLGNYLLDWSYLDATAQQSLQSKLHLQLLTLSITPPAVFTLKQAGSPVAEFDGNAKCSDFALESAWFLAAPDGVPPADGPGWYNALVGVYSFSLSTDGTDSVTAYSAFALPDITLTSSGLAFQAADAELYRTAELDRASFAVSPYAGYRVQSADFTAAATLETAAAATPAPVAPDAAVPEATPSETVTP